MWRKSQVWLKIWNVTLDKGPRGTKSMLALLFEITKPAFRSKPCPYCDIDNLDSSLFHHLMETHPHDYVLVQQDPAKISQLLVDIDSDSDIFYIAEKFLCRTYLDCAISGCPCGSVSIITFEPLNQAFLPHTGACHQGVRQGGVLLKSYRRC